MKKLSAFKIFAALVIVFSLFVVQVSASVDTTLQQENAKALVKLEILKGYPDGSLGLEDKIQRCQFFALVVRMLGYDKDADIDKVSIPFTDIDKSHWAYNSIKAAYKYGLVAGNPDNTVSPNNYITYAEELTVLIRALGFENTMTGKWPDNVINKAAELGITKNTDLAQNKQVTRGETSVIIYNSLTVEIK